MNKKAIIASLRTLFSQLEKDGTQYAEAWLEHADFGGMFMSGKYILYVRTLDEAPDRGAEIKKIVYLLYEKAPVEYDYIFQVVIYGAREHTYDPRTPMIVYEHHAA